MRLTQALIKRIESFLQPDSVCELRTDGDNIAITARPPEEGNIDLPTPVLICADDPTRIRIQIMKAGEDPIHIQDIDIEPGFWLAGLRGYFSKNAEGQVK